MAYYQNDHPEIIVKEGPNPTKPKKRHRTNFAVTNQFLESLLFGGQRLLSVSYDPTREIVTFHVDMDGYHSGGYEVAEGQEAIEYDWIAYNKNMNGQDND